jgi:hypothetical protein
MSQWGYVAVAYLVTFGAIGLYWLRVWRRGRALARALPSEERAWR